MGYHENGQAQSALERPDQFVEVARADRIEAGGRLIEEHQFRIERERTRQRHALDHAARQFRRKAVGNLRPQAHHRELRRCDLVEQPLRDGEIFAHRKLDILTNGQRREQRALLEQDAPAPLHRAARGGIGGIEIDAEHFDAAGDLRHEADDGARQHRLAGAGGPDEAEDLAAPHIEIEPVEHARRAELHGDVAHPDDRI